MNKTAIRIQIACFSILQAEVIVTDFNTANKVWAQFSCAKYFRGKQIGGAIISLASLPRYWNVPVGSAIK